MANSISVSQPRLHGSKRFRVDNEGTNVKEKQNVTNPQRNDSDCSSVASSSGCSSSNSNDQNQVQPPPSKRRVSFNAQPLICQSSGTGNQKLAKELNNNLSFHESFRERLNKTEASVDPEATASPFSLRKNKLAPKLFTDVLKQEETVNSPMSMSFSHGLQPQMTPQRPLGESLFYRNNRRESLKSSVTAAPAFNASVFGTPVFLPSPSNPHIKTRAFSSLSQTTGGTGTQVPLSENALKILKRLEQPVTHTEIYRMRKLGSLKTFSPMSVLPKSPIQANEEIPSAPLPSFSFLSSKRVMPPRTTPPSFKLVSNPASKSPINPLKFSTASKKPSFSNQSTVSKTNFLDEDQGFTFMMPTPRKFGFEGGLSSDTSSKKALSFNIGNVAPSNQSGEESVNGDPTQLLEAPEAVEKPELNSSGMAKLASKFKLKAGSWECTQCLSKNDSSLTKCAACEFAKPEVKTDGKEPNTAFTAALGQNVNLEQQQKLAQLSKPSSDSCSGDACLVVSKASDSSAACHSDTTKKHAESPSKTFLPSSSLKSTSIGSNKLAEKFKRPSGAWDCSTCLVTNKGDDTQCVACQSAKLASVESKPPTSLFGSTSKTFANADVPKFAFGSGSLTNAVQPFSFSTSSAVPSLFNPPTDSKDQGKPTTFTFGGANPTFKPAFGPQKDPSSQKNGSGFTFGSFAPTDSDVKNSFQPSLTAGTNATSGFNFGFSTPNAKLQNSNDHSGTNFVGLSNGSSEDKKLIPSFSFSAPFMASSVNSGPVQQQDSTSVLKPVFGLR